MKHAESSMVQVIEVLRSRGYTEDFNLLEENLSYRKDGAPVNPEDLVIDRIYRFSGLNDVDDEAILYAMHHTRDGAKGIFVNGYGTYTDAGADRIISRITVRELEELDFPGLSGTLG